MNIISAERASRLDIPLEGKRGYLVVSSDISQNDFKEIVETRIVEAFHKGNRSEALQELNQFFIHTDLDFRNEFRKDLIPVEELRILIDSAFKTVVRGKRYHASRSGGKRRLFECGRNPCRSKKGHRTSLA
ncbi:hypothetical protein BRAT_09195 [Leptospira interrogans serovar Bratislava]|nr:hypothetical protein [Leptospira interrogans]AKH78987.1 hypothetical protein BRAT_09195 [Leptospira interrogans serovar Bratislava]EMJ45994.1 hypothetical protein LEP1GSC111_1587 [Leptospira interrogans str. UT126]